LIEFASVVGAVDCSVALQRLAAERNTPTPADRRMEWRIGVHLGDVLVEGDDILGDDVNIAARLEGTPSPAASASRTTPSTRCRAKSTPSSSKQASRS
jgi:adenylate cyclase